MSEAEEAERERPAGGEEEGAEGMGTESRISWAEVKAVERKGARSSRGGSS